MADAASFIAALQRLEADNDPEPLAALHAPDAAVSNPLVSGQYRGPDGARDFWRRYRQSFGAIQSRFDHVVETGGLALLEWRSTGTVQGRAVDYRGVTVLEFADGMIAAFRTYFDTRHLGAQIGEVAAG